MIEFSVTSETTGFSARLFVRETIWLPETGLTLHFHGQQIGSQITWLDTMAVMTCLRVDTPILTDERFDPELDALAILSTWDDTDSVARSARPHGVGVFDDYLVICYRWAEDTVIVTSCLSGRLEEVVLPMKWIIPTSTFQQVLLALCHINSFILQKSGDLGRAGLHVERREPADYSPFSEPMRFASIDDVSGSSLRVDYVANDSARSLQMFSGSIRIPVFAMFGHYLSDLKFLADDVFDVDPDRFNELDPHQSPRQLIKTLMEHPDPEIRGGVKRNPPSGYERFQTYVYGWCEETVIAFAPNPFTARSTPDVWVIRNDDFRFMLKCAIDLFGTHTNLFPAELELEHGV